MKTLLLFAALAGGALAQTSAPAPSTTPDVSAYYKVPGTVACTAPITAANCPSYPYAYPYAWLRIGAGLALRVIGGAPQLSVAGPPRLVYSSAYAGNIQRAIDALPAAGGEVVVDADFAATATIALRDNVHLRGVAAPVVSMADPAAAVFAAAHAQNVAIEGLQVEGGRAGVLAFAAPGLRIRRNSFNGWNWRAIGLGADSPDVRIEDNRIGAPALLTGSAGCVDGIFAEDTGPGLKIRGNTLDTRGCLQAGTDGAHGIAVHTFSGGVDAPEVTGNVITHGGSNFAVEVGQFGTGGRIAGPIVRANRIWLAAPSNGAVSVAGTDRAAVGENSIDLGGIAPQIMAIELADSQAPTVTGNTVRGGPADARAFILDSSSDALVTGNRFEGLVSLNNSGTFPGVLGLARNTFAGNVFTLPAGSKSAWRVLVQCNVDGCDGSDNRFGANRGLAAADVRLQPDKGAITGTDFGPPALVAGFGIVAIADDATVEVRADTSYMLHRAFAGTFVPAAAPSPGQCDAATGELFADAAHLFLCVGNAAGNGFIWVRSAVETVW